MSNNYNITNVSLSMLFFFLVTTFFAQPNLIKKEKFQSHMMSMERIKTKKVETFLNLEYSDEDRISAIENVFLFNQENQIERAVNIFQNKNENTVIRVIAMKASIGQIGKDNQLISYLMTRLVNIKEEAAFRRACISTLQSLTFSSKQFLGRRSEFMSHLKLLLTDEDQQLREDAFSYLTKYNDDFAQQKLINGLKDSSKALVSPAQSIRMLGNDIHADYYPVLHEVMINTKDEETKMEAIRYLGSYQKSHDAIKGYMLDQNENANIRKICIATLSANDTQNFTNYAQAFITDKNNDSSLRIYSLNAIKYNSSKEELKNNAAFIDSIKSLQTDNESNEVKQVINNLLRKIE